MDWYEISEVNLGKNKYVCFELFEVWVLDFSLKVKTTRKIYNRNEAELAHCTIVFYIQKLGTNFFDTGILVWHLFSLGLLKLLLLYLIGRRVGNQVTVLFHVAWWNGMARKGYINVPWTSCLWKENGFSFIFSKMNWQLIV